MRDNSHRSLAPSTKDRLKRRHARILLTERVRTEPRGGQSTGAVAQSYFHTLYVGQAWDPPRSVEHLDQKADIHVARLHTMEGHDPLNACAAAEIDLCAQATLLMDLHTPDYMLVHSCSADTPGHTFGGVSGEYRRRIWHIDNALSRAIPAWRDLGYDVIVPADHGMTADGWHGGTGRAATEVPFCPFSDAEAPAEGKELSQLGVAASVLTLIGVPPADGVGDGFLSPRPTVP